MRCKLTKAYYIVIIIQIKKQGFYGLQIFKYHLKRNYISVEILTGFISKNDDKRKEVMIG